ncbi:MAG: cytochrome c biogenesis protein ResB [Deltaproteobacteria bacterium]
MSATRIHSKPKSWLWGTLTSIRLTVFILLILAAVAVIGTVLPQNQPPGLYVRLYGAGWGGLLWRGGFTHVYFSPWFLVPMGLLALNICACIVHGLPQAVKRALRPLSVEAALALPERGRVTWPADVDPHPVITAALSRESGHFRREKLADQEIYHLERGRLRPLGPYLIHVALLLILAGGLIGKFWGVEGRLALDQGGVASAFQVGPKTEKPLHFQVRLDKFKVSYYEPGGTPKEFRSDLTFLKDGRDMAQAVCRVNAPANYGGWTFYQASYGAEATGPIRLKLQGKNLNRTMELPMRQLVELPGGRGRIIAMRVDGNLQGYGPAVLLGYSSGAGHPRGFWVLQDHPFLGEQPDSLRFIAQSIPFKYYSVFQVRHDPGVWWVYTGFLMFLPGLYLAFFRPAERWALVVTPNPQGGWQARLLGASPRAREAFAARQERLLKGLQRGTPL